MGKLGRKRRINKKLLVSICGNTHLGADIIGVTSNISETGICIITDRILPLNEHITVSIAAEENIFYLEGESIWNSIYSDSVIGTGIFLVSSSLDYIDFVYKENYH